MVAASLDEQSNKWLAIFGGRFLPVDEFEYSMEREVDHLRSAKQVSFSMVASEEYSGSIVTRRNPYAHPNRTSLFVCGPTEKLRFTDVTSFGSIDRHGNKFFIDFRASGLTKCER